MISCLLLIRLVRSTHFQRLRHQQIPSNANDRYLPFYNPSRTFMPWFYLASMTLSPLLSGQLLTSALLLTQQQSSSTFCNNPSLYYHPTVQSLEHLRQS